MAIQTKPFGSEETVLHDLIHICRRQCDEYDCNEVSGDVAVLASKCGEIFHISCVGGSMDELKSDVSILDTRCFIHESECGLVIVNAEFRAKLRELLGEGIAAGNDFDGSIAKLFGNTALRQIDASACDKLRILCEHRVIKAQAGPQALLKRCIVNLLERFLVRDAVGNYTVRQSGCNSRESLFRDELRGLGYLDAIKILECSGVATECDFDDVERFVRKAVLEQQRVYDGIFCKCCDEKLQSGQTYWGYTPPAVKDEIRAAVKTLSEKLGVELGEDYVEGVLARCRDVFYDILFQRQDQRQEMNRALQRMKPFVQGLVEEYGFWADDGTMDVNFALASPWFQSEIDAELKKAVLATRTPFSDQDFKKDVREVVENFVKRNIGETLKEVEMPQDVMWNDLQLEGFVDPRKATSSAPWAYLLLSTTCATVSTVAGVMMSAQEPAPAMDLSSRFQAMILGTA